MTVPSKVRYMVSPSFIRIGAHAVHQRSVEMNRFVTITATVWAYVERAERLPEHRLQRIVEGYDRAEFTGKLPIHLARHEGVTEILWRLTRRIQPMMEGSATHLDAITCGLLAALDPDEE